MKFSRVKKLQDAIRKARTYERKLSDAEEYLKICDSVWVSVKHLPCGTDITISIYMDEHEEYTTYGLGNNHEEFSRSVTYAIKDLERNFFPAESVNRLRAVHDHVIRWCRDEETTVLPKKVKE